MDGNSKQLLTEAEYDARKRKSRRIFERFTDATMALLDCDDAPAGVHKAVADMVDYFGNELDGNPDFNGFHAHRVMSKVFELDEYDEEPAKEAPEPPAQDDQEVILAAEELANAFATIREYWAYVPFEVRNATLDGIQTDILNSVSWQDDLASYRRVLFALLQAPERVRDVA